MTLDSAGLQRQYRRGHSGRRCRGQPGQRPQQSIESLEHPLDSVYRCMDYHYIGAY